MGYYFGAQQIKSRLYLLNKILHGLTAIPVEQYIVH